MMKIIPCTVRDIKIFEIEELRTKLISLERSLLLTNEEAINNITYMTSNTILKLNDYRYYNIILDIIEVSDSIISKDFNKDKIYEKKHNDGWTIKGKINYLKVKNDIRLSVTLFEAEHEIYGKIYGDLNDEIVISSIEAYNHFIFNHKLLLRTKSFFTEDIREFNPLFN
jgi:hypothetical protein